MLSNRAWLLGLILLSVVLTGCYRGPVGMSVGAGYYDDYAYGYPDEYPFYDSYYPLYYYPYYSYYPAFYLGLDYLFFPPYFYGGFRGYPYYYGYRGRGFQEGSPFHVTPMRPGGGLGGGGGFRHR